MRMFNYGGVVSQNLLITDLADIKFIDFVNTFHLPILSDKERLLISKIKEKLLLGDAGMALTASDSRLVFVFVKLMVKYPKAKPYYGLNEWVLVYSFLKNFYDKSLPEIDNVIRFFNLYIGKMFAEEANLSGADLKELVSLYNTVATALQSYKEIIPAFVYEEIKDEFQLDGIYLDKYDTFVVEENLDSLITALA
jgi:hypothetical protein